MLQDLNDLYARVRKHPRTLTWYDVYGVICTRKSAWGSVGYPSSMRTSKLADLCDLQVRQVMTCPNFEIWSVVGGTATAVTGHIIMAIPLCVLPYLTCCSSAVRAHGCDILH